MAGGLGADLLLGGKHTITPQPISAQTQTQSGLNLAGLNLAGRNLARGTGKLQRVHTPGS